MTRDCGHSTGAETADIVQGKYQGHSTDDQRLRTFGEGGGERVPEFDRYPLPLPELCFPLLPAPASVTAGCPLRMRERSTALCEWLGAFW
ncbi:unnamed protein product, partial [Staurois parvus]